jgi:hypothetical protein
MTDRYVFPVVDAQVIDGDTYRLTLDPGFRFTTVQPIRLDGWDTPEKHPVAIHRPGITSLNHEVQEALRAQQTSINWFDTCFHDGSPVWCRTKKDPDSFGRWLGTVWALDGAGQPFYLHETLERYHLVTPWPTRWWTVWGNGYEAAMEAGAERMRKEFEKP